MRLRLPLVTLLLCTLAASASAWASKSSAAAAHSAAPAAATAKTPDHKLGNVNVKGVAAIKAAVHALQTIKLALKEPFSVDPALADVTVCRLEHRSRGVHAWERMHVILECGSNSWFTWRRTNCQHEGITDCAAGLRTSAYERKGAWHSERLLDFRQAAALRQLVKTLPPPGSTRTIIVTGYSGAPEAVSHR